jgi:RNA polymerase sigma-70 factor, ECF subfamily
MSSHAEPDPTAVGLRALYAAVQAQRAAARLASGPGVVWRARRRAADPTRANGAGPRANGATAAGNGMVPPRGPVDGVRAPRAGPAGPEEPSGREEPSGPDGTGGAVGPDGTGGTAGPDGTDGTAGPDGTDGTAGPDGRAGVDGLDESGAAAPEGPDRETWALVRAAQGGDAEAFGRLYDRYVGLVYRYAYHRLGDRPQAEDVTSETFLRALRRIGTLQYQGRDIGAWFVTIARNLVLDHRKSGRARLEIATAELPEYDAGDRPEAAVLTRIANASLLACVRQLNPEQQECVVLRFLNGMSVAETAEIMDKNEGAIKALQHRAIRRLATLLPEDPR